MKVFEVVDVESIMKLFNAQKARVYEFYIDLNKRYKKQTGDYSPRFSYRTYQEWTNEASRYWDDEGYFWKHDEVDANRKAFQRVRKAKIAFEKAGGKFKI